MADIVSRRFAPKLEKVSAELGVIKRFFPIPNAQCPMPNAQSIIFYCH
ncbi:MAG: hypothetical protein V7K98_08700 [Nostoc sp.]